MSFDFLEQILILFYIFACLAYFSFAVAVRVRMVLAARPESEKQGLAKAVARFVSEVVMQTKVIRDRPFPGLLHAFVFWGFIIYIPATIHHFLLPYTGGYLHGPVAEGYRLFMTWVSAVVAVSIAGLAFRRFVLRPAYFEKKVSWTSGLVALFIFTLMVTYIADPYLSGAAAKANWWAHASGVLLFLVVIPHSKHLHLVVSPFNLALMRAGFGRVPPFVIDMESMESEEEMKFGVATPADTGRETRLDALSCVECGRCTEHCPANKLGKALDPRSIIHNFEKPLVHGKADNVFDGGIINAEAVWQCVTCGACEFYCPVGVQHLPLLLQLRRNLALDRAEIPEQMVNVYKSLQNKGNVWVADRERRGELIEEMQLPLYEKGKVLIWSSCFFLTAEFGAKVKRLSQLLARAGIEAGICPEEVCCGDPARKTGEEDTFQTLAMANIEWMKAGGVETIVSPCPHCLHTISEAYPQLDPEFKVETIHHSALLAMLRRQGKLESEALDGAPSSVHDPCYVSRWGIGDMAALRELARGATPGFRELPLSGMRSYCCGSGGGAHHFFEDGDRVRIDDERIEQVLASGVSRIYTACPFCFNMITEGLKRGEGEPQLKVEDITALLRL